MLVAHPAMALVRAPLPPACLVPQVTFYHTEQTLLG